MPDRNQGRQAGTGASGSTPGATTTSGTTAGSGYTPPRQPLGSTPTYGTTATEESGASRVADAARDVRDRVTEKAGERARGLFDDQKSKAVEGAQGIGRALRSTASSLRSEDQATTATYLDRAAERIEQISGRLDRQDLDEVIYSAQQFARRKPALFFGGALAIGFLAARFMKASNERFGGYDEFEDIQPSRYDRPATTVDTRGYATTYASELDSDFSSGGGAGTIGGTTGITSGGGATGTSGTSRPAGSTTTSGGRNPGGTSGSGGSTTGGSL